MTRRSYLQRIAAPLAAGEPVLVPMPRPAPGEGRPAARGGARAPDVAPEAAKPALRRAPARIIAAPAAGRVRTDTQAGGPTRVLAARAPALPNAVDSPPAAPVFGAPGPDATPGRHQTAAEWIAYRDAMPGVAATPRPAEPSVTTGGALEWGAPVTLRAMPAIPPAQQNQAAPAPTRAAVAPARASTLAIAPVTAVRAPRGAEAMAFADMAPRLQPQAQPSGPAAPTPAADPAAQPRIHIGTIEVRTSPAGPPQPTPPLPSRLSAPAAPTGSAPRGYGWRYGLSQR